MDLGAGIAIAAIAVSLASVVITAIKIRPDKKTDDADLCPLHSGVNSTLTFVKEQLNKLEYGLSTIHQDIKNILIQIGDKDDD